MQSMCTGRGGDTQEHIQRVQLICADKGSLTKFTHLLDQFENFNTADIVWCNNKFEFKVRKMKVELRVQIDTIIKNYVNRIFVSW